MLEYEWGNPLSIILTGNEEDEPTHRENSDQTHRQIFDHYASQSNALLPDHFLCHQQPTHNTNPTSSFSHHHNHHHHHHSFNPLAHNPIHHSLFDPRSFAGASSTSYPPPLPPAPQPHNSLLSLDPLFVVPKTEDFSANSTSSSTILGLNLGGRTYFSTDDDFVNRLYRRSRAVEPGAYSSFNSPKCQAEGCNADLSNAKHYHRRHKVCEFHSKAATVIAAGLTQRFCQQCSRFHLLAEFDNGKRSCRKRLADHNRRRRKSQQHPSQENQKPHQETPSLSSSNNVSRSQSDPAGAYSSSVTLAVSSPVYVGPRPFQSTSSSTTPKTTNTPFFHCHYWPEQEEQGRTDQKIFKQHDH